MTTAIVTDARFAAHTLTAHVERAERLSAVEQALAASGLARDLLHLVATPASEAALAAAHSPRLISAIRRLSEYGGGAFDPDTYVTADSWEVVTLAAGGVIRMVQALVHGECDNGFALTRPPGHHATAERAMGFCLVNHIAVAARYALDQLSLERVAIVDYDVHHGNGTQDIFYDDPRVLFCSTHAAPFYPGSGTLSEIGTPAALGSTLNVPLPFGVGDAGYEQVLTQAIAPALRRWQPQLILVSAGYDAHWSDPLGPMTVSVSGFTTLTTILNELARELCGGKIALVLEGGYNLEALGASVVASLRVLMGRAPEADPLGIYTRPEPALDGLLATLRRSHPLLK
jgi:acetoin utilization deacetylase AcuC-like enzyme